MVYDVLIVGAGLAGLCCARRVQQAGLRFLLVEASDGVGGRIRTDRVEGFQLDRGFQVFLTAYPEAKRFLDYHRLDLRSFQPGALVRYGGAFHRIADPWRRPFQGLCSLFAPIGTILDKARVGRMRSRALKGTMEDLFKEPETTTLQALHDAGFSHSMVERFFRPFLGGIFLESALQTSSRMFDFDFRMFSSGDACLPANGMEAIPRQLAEPLPTDSIRLRSRVARVQPGSIQLDSGETLQSRAVVMAAEAPVAAKLLDVSFSAESHGVNCLYFAADRAPVDEPLLVLNGEGRGPVNNLCVPSVLSPSYAPHRQHLISATVLGESKISVSQLQDDVRDQLAGWFGPQVKSWRHLRTYRIPYALPRQFPPALSPPERPVRWQPGIYVCGDHRDNASIQGAMVSGRRAAKTLLNDLS